MRKSTALILLGLVAIATALLSILSIEHESKPKLKITSQPYEIDYRINDLVEDSGEQRLLLYKLKE